MRDYARVAPSFWTRGSGKALRGDPEAQVLALFLVTCPNANMIGLYYVPLVSVAYESGLGTEKTSAAMKRLAASGFAFYDEDAELAWVPNMASYQIGDEMRPGDKKRAAVIAEVERAGRHPYVRAFWNRYAESYSLGVCPLDARGCTNADSVDVPIGQGASRRADGASADPGRAGEEQAQEQEQEKSRSKGASGDAGPDACASSPSSPKTDPEEPKPKARKGQRLPRTFIREDWKPTPEHEDYVRANGLDLDAVVTDFRNYHLGKGEPSANWNATFRQNVDRILRTDWLIARFAVRDSPPGYTPPPEPTYGPPSEPPPGLLDRLTNLGKAVTPPLLREVMDADAERGSDVRIKPNEPTGTDA